MVIRQTATTNELQVTLSRCYTWRFMFACYSHWEARSSPETCLPSTDGASMICRHSGQKPNCWMTLEPQGRHRHRWPQGRVTLTSLPMHTTQSIALLSSVVKTEMIQLEDSPTQTVSSGYKWADIYISGWMGSNSPAGNSMLRRDAQSSPSPAGIRL